MASVVLTSSRDCPQLTLTWSFGTIRSPRDPDGNIVMSIAENRLTVDLIKEKLQCQHTFPDSVFYYDNMTGTDRLKAAMLMLVHSTFMQVTLHHNCLNLHCFYTSLLYMALDPCDTVKPTQGVDLQPQNLTILSGCGAIINNLIYCITEPGEGIALPAPYYPAFDYDIRVSGLHTHKHHLVITWHP